MNNKRGIAQAFGNLPKVTTLRPAQVFDVFALSQVLIRSITQLCAADHLNDPQHVARWTANKDPETIRGWITSGAQIWMAERAGQAAAVGGISDSGRVTLLYVDPAHVGQGIGSQLLRRLEHEIATSGHAEAQLDATRTALDFYVGQGWEQSGPAQEWHGVPQFPMRKSLQPRD